MNHAHPLYKLGKGAARADARNIKFASIAKPIVAPASYDFDATRKGVVIPMPMFANDQYGDCVMAGRAHQTLRFELVEQGQCPAIGDADVLAEYMKETGGADSGLVVLDSLKRWRAHGWKVDGRTYKIAAFAQVDVKNHDEVRAAIYTRVGVGLGLQLPTSAQLQTETGRPWSVVKGRDSKPGSWGGHYVYVPCYDPFGPVCITWGRMQRMSWAFFDAYCDEAYSMIDARDTNARGTFDAAALANELARV